MSRLPKQLSTKTGEAQSCVRLASPGPAPAIAGVEVIAQPWSLEQEVPLIQQFVTAGFCAGVVGVIPLPDSARARGK